MAMHARPHGRPPRAGDHRRLSCSCVAEVVAPLILSSPTHMLATIRTPGSRCRTAGHARGRRVVVRRPVGG